MPSGSASQTGMTSRGAQMLAPSRLAGDSASCTIVAEVAQAHDGSLGMAHAYIDAAAKCGVDAVKFQTHIAAAESTPAEPWRVPFGYQDASRFDYWKRMEFTEDQWLGLRRHAEDRGLLFLSSPFSIEATELLSRVGVAAWKIASGEITNAPMLDTMMATRLPVLVSTGMSSLSEIDALVAKFRAARHPLALLQCTSSYPCPPDQVGLNVLQLYRDRYGVPVGLSDHSGTIFPGLAAATLGIAILEVHVTMSREMFGPDVSSSVTTAELAQLVAGVRFIETMHANPVDKDELASGMEPLRRLFTRSVVARRPLEAGTVLAETDLALKKPGTGLPPSELPALIGKRLVRRLALDEPVQNSDLEGQ